MGRGLGIESEGLGTEVPSGGRKSPTGVQGQSPGMGSGTSFPQKLKRFYRATLYVARSYSYRNSVCLSVCQTRGLCPHGSTYDHGFFTIWKPISLVFRDIRFIPKFKGGHSERGRWMRVGWVRIRDFRPISRRISETVRDTTKVTINH